MSARRAISNATVLLNSETILVVPNSVIIVMGQGSTVVKNESAGGDTTSLVVARDLTSAIGQLKFKIRNTPENILQIASFKLLIGSILAQVLGNTGTFTGVMSSASITNDPEYMFGVDSEIEVMLEGDPWVVG